MSSVFELNSVSIHFKPVRRRNLLFRMSGNRPKQNPSQVIKALDNVTLKMARGQNIGLIGRNGAGKTTLMRLLAGIYAPDSGEVINNASSASLLSYGVGFENQATGYENIYLSSLLKGYSKKEIQSKVQQIIEFSGIEEFIDYPVKTYSSGMRARLAFSIAVHFEPEVLLIDEALAVGDAEFSKRSAARMNELIDESHRTVIIASHTMSYLENNTDEVIWLDKGTVRMHGEPKTVINAYLEEVNAEKKGCAPRKVS